MSSPGLRSCCPRRSRPRNWTGGEVSLDLVNPSTPAELRAKLVHDACATWFPGSARKAAEDEHGFISLDAGLAVIAEHAKSLGYHGLILFMDELILWLANRVHDQKFVSREADKITNFVEGADSRRAVPIVSFIARQRDLRELVGEEISGAAEAAIQGSLRLASGRFDTITLEDRNLPQVAHARLLTPKDAEAAAKLDAVRQDQAGRAAGVGCPAGVGRGNDGRGRGVVPPDVSLHARLHGHAGAHLVGPAAVPYRSEADGSAAGSPWR